VILIGEVGEDDECGRWVILCMGGNLFPPVGNISTMIIPVKSFYLSLFPYEGVGGDAASGGRSRKSGAEASPKASPPRAPLRG
jgi:hypothetical protein